MANGRGHDACLLRGKQLQAALRDSGCGAAELGEAWVDRGAAALLLRVHTLALHCAVNALELDALPRALELRAWTLKAQALHMLGQRAAATVAKREAESRGALADQLVQTGAAESVRVTESPHSTLLQCDRDAGPATRVLNLLAQHW